MSTLAIAQYELRVGGGCAPPPPVAAPLASSLRAPSRGDPPHDGASPGSGVDGSNDVLSGPGLVVAADAVHAVAADGVHLEVGGAPTEPTGGQLPTWPPYPQVYRGAGVGRYRPALIAGLMVGLAECLFFAFALASPRLEEPVVRAFGFAARQHIGSVGMALVVAVPILAGVGFTWLLDRQPGARASGWRAWPIGLILLLASIVGVFVAGGLEPLALSKEDAGRLLVFRVAFTLASGIAAFLCTLASGLILQRPAAARHAALTGAVTAATYLVYLLIIDLLPGWHVGGGDMAMPRIAMLGNLVAGTLGGASAFELLRRANPSP